MSNTRSQYSWTQRISAVGRWKNISPFISGFGVDDNDYIWAFSYIRFVGCCMLGMPKSWRA
jgi:hypothetical protein